jgi:hypothetical protein
MDYMILYGIIRYTKILNRLIVYRLKDFTKYFKGVIYAN